MPLMTPAFVGTQPLYAVVDTGAAITIISWDAFCRLDGAAKLLMPYSSTPFAIRGVSGAAKPVRGEAKLEICVHGCTWKGRVLILDGAHEELILGIDCLKGLKIHIDLENDLLYFGDHIKVPFVVSENGTVGKVRVRNDMILPARTAVFVQVLLENEARLVGQRVLLTPRSFGCNRQSLMGHCLQQVPQANTTAMEVLLTNCLDQDVRLRRGQLVATAELLESSCVVMTVTEARQAETSDEAGERIDQGELNKVSTFDIEESLSHCDPMLHAQQVQELRELIVKYQHLFVHQLHRTVNEKVPEVRIDIGDGLPIRHLPYRISQAERQAVRQEIHNLQANGYIRPSDSPWASRIVLVKKKDGTTRFCVDYRPLNAVTRKDAYPLPRIDDMIDQLGKAKFFSTLDMASGYHQLRIAEQDIPKTAFTSWEGNWEYTVMPFGLTNAPAAFQRAMDVILMGISWQMCMVYIDDIIIYSPTFEQHLSDLETVLKRLDSVSMAVKLRKCQFCRQALSFLGHVVTSDGVHVDNTKVEAIKNMRRPVTAKELRRFLGLCGYYRRFVKQFAEIARPLSALTSIKLRGPLPWNHLCDAAFEELKQRLSSAPILAYPNFKKPFILHTDASSVAIGAVLAQEDDAGAERVVSYASKTLQSAEIKYSTSERECLAVVTWVKVFRPYLHGRPFKLVTDHSALLWLLNLKDPSSRLARWALRLQEYQYDIVYRQGSRHSNADAMTRAPVVDECKVACNMARLSTEPKIRVTRQQTRLLREAEEYKRQQEEASTSTTASGVLDVTVRDDNLKIPPSSQDVRGEPEMNVGKDVSSIPESRHQEDPTEPVQEGPEELVIDITPAEIDRLWTEISESAENATAKQKHFALKQWEDEECRTMMIFLWNGTTPADPMRAIWVNTAAEHMHLVDGCLYRQWKPQSANQRCDLRLQLVAPRMLRKELLEEFHDDRLAGHMGRNATFKKLRSLYWWPSMYKDTAEWVSTCQICQGRSKPLKPNRAPLQPIQVGRPLHRVGIDIVGPLPRTPRGNAYILVMMDYFTKWPEIAPLPDVQASTVAKHFIESVICRHGAPQILLSDRGKQFMSKMLKQVIRYLGIKKDFTTAYHPQTDGLVERFNRTMVDMLSKVVKPTQRDWDEWLPAVAWAYRVTPQESTGETPFYLMHGRDPVFPSQVGLFPREHEWTLEDFKNDLVIKLEAAKTLTEENIKRAQQKQKQYADKGLIPTQFCPGELVYLRVEIIKQGRKVKLAQRWKGPYRVVKDQGSGVYVIANIFDPDDQQRVNIQRLKKLRHCEDTEGLSGEGDGNPAMLRQNPVPDINAIDRIVRMHIRNGTEEFFCKFVNRGNHVGEWKRLEEIEDLSLVDEFLHFRLKGQDAPALLNKETGFTSEERLLLIRELAERQARLAARRLSRTADKDKGKEKSW